MATIQSAMAAWRMVNDGSSEPALILTTHKHLKAVAKAQGLVYRNKRQIKKLAKRVTVPS